jgi:hypothetical protein
LEQYTLIVRLVYWNVTIKIHLIFNLLIKCDNLQFLTRHISSTVKPAHAVASIKQSPVIKGHLFLVLSYKISY